MYVISTVYVPSTHFYPKMLGVFFGNQSLKCLQRTLKRFWTWNPVPWQGSSATTHGVVASRSPFLLGQRGTLLRFWVNTFSGGPEPLKQRNILLSWPTSKISKKYHTSIRIYHLILQIYTTTKNGGTWCPTTTNFPTSRNSHGGYSAQKMNHHNDSIPLGPSPIWSGSLSPKAQFLILILCIAIGEFPWCRKNFPPCWNFYHEWN